MIASHRLAKGVPVGVAAGAGDHAAVQVGAEALGERDGGGGGWGRGCEWGCWCCGEEGEEEEEEEEGGVGGEGIHYLFVCLFVFCFVWEMVTGRRGLVCFQGCENRCRVDVGKGD